MLRLHFRTGKGESPKLIQTVFVRFCADGSLRGPENCLVARCGDVGWWVGGKLHRELECEGPIRLRVSVAGAPVVHYGPFAVVRTTGGEFYGDEQRLNILIPGSSPEAARLGHELTMFSQGVQHGETQLPARETAKRGRAQGPSTGEAAAQAVARRRGDSGAGGR